MKFPVTHVKMAKKKAAGVIETDNVDLKKEIFGLDVRRDVLARVVRWQLARRRAGTHKTRGISEIRGTTARPWNQKGTGRARQGSRRSPQFRGGAVIFGPQVRSHAHKLTRQFRSLGLRTALSAKHKSGDLKIVDNLGGIEAKTALLVKQMDALALRSALIVTAEKSETMGRSAANIPHVDVLPVAGINVYDILRRRCLVLTRDALTKLEERLS